jgi:hypothetical protein
MEAVITPAQDTEPEIDLGRGRDFEGTGGHGLLCLN